MAEQELCGAPHPWMPHRKCLREKGHTDEYITGWRMYSPHRDHAGDWKGKDD